MSNADDENSQVLIVIMKLLDKAGDDPRLTARILRGKAEERLKLSAGSLKSKREMIKKIIVKWWNSKHSSSLSSSADAVPVQSEEDKALQRLNKLTRNVGLSGYFKSTSDLPTKQRIDSIVKK